MFFDAVDFLDETVRKIQSSFLNPHFAYAPGRIFETPIYGDSDHIERVAVRGGEVVAFICCTLDHREMICPSVTLLAFRPTDLTVRLFLDTAEMIFDAGFRQIFFVAAEDNRAAVRMWDRGVKRWFRGGRTGDIHYRENHTGRHRMIRWKIEPQS